MIIRPSEVAMPCHVGLALRQAYLAFVYQSVSKFT